MHDKPDILDRRIVAHSRLFNIEQVELRFANGVQVQYERLLGSPRGGVLVIPMLDTDTVLLIREYGAGTQRYELALPKGRIEPGEAPAQAANREIMEEVGYGARRLQHITSLTMAPGYSNHHTHVVLAEDLYEQREPGDEPEEIEVVPWRLSELDSLLARDDLTEARSIAALFLAREHFRHE